MMQETTVKTKKKKSNKRKAAATSDVHETAKKKRNENNEEMQKEKENKRGDLEHPSPGSCHAKYDQDYKDIHVDKLKSAKTPVHDHVQALGPPAPIRKYKGYVYVPVEDVNDVHVEDKDNETPLNPKNGKPQRKRRATQKCLDFFYE